MKLSLILLSLFIFTSYGFSQIDKYKIVGKTLVRKDKDGRFLYQKEWKECDNLVIVDMRKAKINFYFDSTSMEFVVKRTETPYKDSDGNLIFNIKCSNENGIPLLISFITTDEPINNFRSFIKLEFSGENILFFRYEEE